jgi:hypothetical protein
MCISRGVFTSEQDHHHLGALVVADQEALQELAQARGMDETPKGLSTFKVWCARRCVPPTRRRCRGRRTPGASDAMRGFVYLYAGAGASRVHQTKCVGLSVCLEGQAQAGCIERILSVCLSGVGAKHLHAGATRRGCLWCMLVWRCLRNCG